MSCAACPEHLPVVPSTGRSDTPPLHLHRIAGFLARLLRAAAPEDADDRRMRRIVARSGGRFTDSMERDAMESALLSRWRRR